MATTSVNRETIIAGWVNQLQADGYAVRYALESEIPTTYDRPATGIFVTYQGRTKRFVFGPDLPRFSPVSGIKAQFPEKKNGNGGLSSVPVATTYPARPVEPGTVVPGGSSGRFATQVERSFQVNTSPVAALAATGGVVTGGSTFSTSSQIEDSAMPVTRSLLSVVPRGFTDTGLNYDLSGFGSALTSAGGAASSAGVSLGPWDVVNQTVQALLPRLPLPGSSTAGQIGTAAGTIARTAGSTVANVARGLKGPAKIFAMLTAAGLTADQISRLISSGAVSLRTTRRRGISATELRGFNRVTSLLHRVGMVPARLGSRAKIHHHRKR